MIQKNIMNFTIHLKRKSSLTVMQISEKCLGQKTVRRALYVQWLDLENVSGSNKIRLVMKILSSLTNFAP